MKVKQIIALVICLVSMLATWLIVWKCWNTYTYYTAFLTAAIALISAWKVGFID